MSIYETCGVTQLHRIQKLLNFSASFVCRKKKYERISHETRPLGFLTASQLVTYHQLCLVRRILVTGEPHESRSLFVSANHEHGTRYSDRLVITRTRTCAGEQCLSNVGLRKFKNLPGEVRSAETMAGFKRALMSALGDE